MNVKLGHLNNMNEMNVKFGYVSHDMKDQMKDKCIYECSEYFIQVHGCVV